MINSDAFTNIFYFGKYLFITTKPQSVGFRILFNTILVTIEGHRNKCQ